jgi:hypothetical protein
MDEALNHSSAQFHSEFDIRFKAARLLVSPSESIRFDGASKTARIGERCILSVDLDAEQLVVSITPTDCPDEALLESLSALPCEPCEHAEITLYRREKRLMPIATVPLGEMPLGRIELQQVRTALESYADRIETLAKDNSQA